MDSGEKGLKSGEVDGSVEKLLLLPLLLLGLSSLNYSLFLPQSLMHASPSLQ